MPIFWHGATPMIEPDVLERLVVNVGQQITDTKDLEHALELWRTLQGAERLFRDLADAARSKVELLARRRRVTTAQKRAH